MNRLVILDRDGVINVESKEFIKSPEEWIAIPHSLEAIAKLNQAGFFVCVATNQSGVGRQLFSLDTLEKIHEKMTTALKALGGHIDEIIYCPHLPTDNCDCRKPKSGMILQLIKNWQVLPENTWVIGDALRDLQAGDAAGCHSLLVRTGKGEQTLREQPHLSNLVFNNLNEAVDYILKQ